MAAVAEEIPVTVARLEMVNAVDLAAVVVLRNCQVEKVVLAQLTRRLWDNGAQCLVELKVGTATAFEARALAVDLLVAEAAQVVGRA